MAAGLDTERIMLTNMDADAQVPALYVQEVDRAAAAAEDPHLLVRVSSTCQGTLCQMLMLRESM